VKFIIDNQIVLSRAPEGPLALHIGPFARLLSKQGYSLYSIHHQVWLAACFSRRLKQQGVGLRSITSDHPPRYLRYRARHARPSLGDAAALRHLLEFLRSEGVIPAEKMAACPLIPAERCTQGYEHYLRKRVAWLAQRSSATSRSSAVFSRIVSATDPSNYRICAPVTS
jgi:integrase/recombinase XerD